MILHTFIFWNISLLEEQTRVFKYLLVVVLMVILAGCAGIANTLGLRRGQGAEVKVVTVTDLGVLETTPFINGRDGGYSGLFAGRSVWLYGDTILSREDEYHRTWHHNSWSWTTDLDPGDGIGAFHEREDAVGAPAEFFALTPEEQAFNDAHWGEQCQENPCGARWALWPSDIVVDGDSALVFYNKVYAEPGAFNFHKVGHSVAIWNRFEESPERPIFRPDAEYPTLLFGQDEPSFGSAALVLDSLVYVYGCELKGFAKPCRLARVPLVDVLDRNAWQFYTSDGHWTDDVGEARPVFDGNDIMKVFYNSYLNRYLAVYSQPLSKKVMLRTAPSPEGPWSKPIKAFQTQRSKNILGVYDALAHPEYSQDEGRMIYITYSRATGDFTSEVRLVEIEIEPHDKLSLYSSEDLRESITLNSEVFAGVGIDETEAEVMHGQTEVTYAMALMNMTYTFDYYVWDKTDSLPFGNGREAPWDTLHKASLGVGYGNEINEKWSYLIGMDGSAAFEKKPEDAYLTGMLGGGFAYSRTEKWKSYLGIGLAYDDFEHLRPFPSWGMQWNEDAESGFAVSLAFPFGATIRYRGPRKKFSILLSRGFPGNISGDLTYQFSPTTDVRLGVGSKGSMHRLTDNNSVLGEHKKGYLSTDKELVDLIFHCSLSEHIQMSIGPYYVFSQTLSIRDRNNDTLYELNPEETFGATLQLRAGY